MRQPSRTSSTVLLMSPSAGGGWGGRTTWCWGNLWSFWHIPQLKWLVYLRWWATKLQPLQWRQMKPQCPWWRPTKLQHTLESWAGMQAGRSTHEVGAGSWHSKTVSSQDGGARSRAHSVPWAHRVRTRARSILGAHRVRSWNRSSQVVNVCSTPGGILLCWPCLGLLPCRPRPGLLFCQPRPGTRVCLFLCALFHSTGLAHLPPRHFSVLVCVWSVWDPLLKGGVVSRSCWCARAGHQMSLCVEHMVCCLLLVPCAPMSTVCPLPSCYLIIVWVVPPVSPSLPSFVSLFSLLVSVVLYWSVVFRRVCYVDCATVLCLPACFFPFGLVFVYFVIKSSFYCVWVLASSLSSRILKLYRSKLSIFLLCQKSLGH